MPAPRLDTIAASLARSEGGPWFLWSDGAEEQLAFGARLRVVVERGRCVALDGAGRPLGEEVATDPFASAERVLAAHAGGPYRAWGYLGFGLAAARYPYLKEADRDLDLFLPRLTVRARGGELVFEGEPALEEAARAVTPEEASNVSVPVVPLAVLAEERARYEAAVAECAARIRRGELTKVIVARGVTLGGALDALATWRGTATLSAARRFALTLDGVIGVGACPEILLTVDRAGGVLTNPLAGTQPRGANDAEDAERIAFLLRDAKEVSEHALSIKLAYDEIASVCAEARVVDFMEVKRYPFTLHLSSRAAGRLAPGRSSWDALRAVFPGVTCTGVPKREALALIDRHELAPRGIYGGAVGWVEASGAMDWGIALRSAFDHGAGVTLQAGAGVVADSDPTYEFEESLHKMKTIASRLVRT